MTLKQFISFVGGLTLTGLIYTIVTYITVFGTFSFSGETLTQKENWEAFFFYLAIFVTVVTIYVIVKRFKLNRKFSATGICIPLLFAFYACFMLGRVYFDNLNYHQDFDKTKWRNSNSKPFNMAKTLTKDNILIGQTKQEIIDMLGTTNDSFKNDRVDYLKYWTDNGTWEFRLYFRNGKVAEAYLYEEGLGI